MESRAGFRLLVVDEDAPITPLHADHYLERLPWLSDGERGPARMRNASALSLWPVTGAVLVALISYFAAQASFAQPELGPSQGQLTVALPPATSYRGPRWTDANGEQARQARAQYLAHLTYELQQLQSSDELHHAGAGKAPVTK